MSANKAKRATPDKRKARSDAAEVQSGTTSLTAITGFVTDDSHQKLLLDRIRLGVVSCLAVADELSFSELKDLLDVSDGNLSTHARKLENAGYIDCRKMFADRQPRTVYAITRAGREALERYLSHMEALIRATDRKA